VENELTARIHREDDAYWAEVVQLPGCFASGKTLDELAEALSEAICVYRTEAGKSPEIANRQPTPRLEVGEMKLLAPARS
jgi:predicted RNase H-like HicB family nuclease